MDKLPNEILYEIFTHLHQQDKAQCMLTCRDYAAAIRRSTQFSTVRLSTLTGLSRFTNIIQQDQSKGEQVGQLVLDFDVPGEIMVHTLFSLLPKVHVLMLNDCFNYNYVNEEAHLPWANTLQSIGDVFGWSVTHSLLTSDVYSNLTKLWCQDEDGKVIAALENAPALEYLNITPGGVVMLSTLETIHQNAPNLKYLRIDALRLDGSDLDYQVSPAPLITTFETEQMEQTFINAEYDLLNYIDKKYPNVTRLDYCNSSEAEDEEIDELFNTRWIPLLRKLAPQIIKLYTFCDERLVDFLKEYGSTYPVKELTFGGIESLKLKELTNLDLLHDLQVRLRTPWEFDWLSNLPVLKKLDMDCYSFKDDDDPSLNNILAHCPPSLQSLLLTSGNFTFQLLDVHAVNVKHLSFTRATLPNGIDAFIAQSFPQLNRLTLSRCTLDRKKFTLLNTDFSCFELEDNFPEENGDVEVTTRSNSKRRRYQPSSSIQSYRYLDTLNIMNDSMAGYSASQPGYDIKSLPYFSLVCNSLQDISLLKCP